MRDEMLSKRQITRAAWFEYKVTKATAGQATEPMLAAEHPPAAFVETELGFGLGEGPSLMAVMQDVARAAERGYVLHGDRTRERKRGPERPKQRASASDRQARLQAMLRVAEAAA